jgi:hypothetical protein
VSVLLIAPACPRMRCLLTGGASTKPPCREPVLLDVDATEQLAFYKVWVRAGDDGTWRAFGETVVAQGDDIALALKERRTFMRGAASSSASRSPTAPPHPLLVCWVHTSDDVVVGAAGVGLASGAVRTTEVAAMRQPSPRGIVIASRCERAVLNQR